MNTHDAILRAHAPFRRWASLTEAGIDINDLIVTDREKINQMIKEYRAKFSRLLMPQFKVTSWKRSSDGPIVNVDEALAGESECFRRRLPHKSPLRIGINVSADYCGNELQAVRGAAVLALVDLCKARGQQTILEVAYGNGMKVCKESRCHVRISLLNPSIETLTRITCSQETIPQMAAKCVRKTASDGSFYGWYRFHEFPWRPEYDFVLDRIETADVATEEKRVLDRLAALKLT